MKYLKVFTDFAKDIVALKDAEVGRLFVALIKYAETGIEPKLPGNERYLWAIAKRQSQFHDTNNHGTKGKSHWNWKGGITPQNQVGRSSIEYNQWRTAVFARDRYTCQNFGRVGGKLNAHHIIPWAADYKKRYEIGNGITLCYECHFNLHHRRG